MASLCFPPGVCTDTAASGPLVPAPSHIRFSNGPLEVLAGENHPQLADGEPRPTDAAGLRGGVADVSKSRATKHSPSFLGKSTWVLGHPKACLSPWHSSEPQHSCGPGWSERGLLLPRVELGFMCTVVGPSA